MLSLEEKSQRVQSYFESRGEISEEQVRSIATGEWLLSVLRKDDAEDIFVNFQETTREQIESLSSETG